MGIAALAIMCLRRFAFGKLADHYTETLRTGEGRDCQRCPGIEASPPQAGIVDGLSDENCKYCRSSIGQLCREKSLPETILLLRQ